jgi:hypothetical protein
MSDTRYELAARAGHPALTDIVCYAGIGLGIALQAFAGHPTSTDVVSRSASFYQQAAVAETPPEVVPDTGYFDIRYHYLIRGRR